MLNKILVRIQNPKVIVAVVSGVLAILINTGLVTLANANHIIDIVNGILAVGVTVGIFGNPESHLPVPVDVAAFVPLEASSPVAVTPLPVPEPVAIPYFTGGVDGAEVKVGG